GHRWVSLLGTGRWHFWAQVGGTAEWHRWVHCWAHVGGTAGHRWVHCWAQVDDLLGTGGRNLWVALLGTDHQCPLMIGADPRSDNCRFSAVLSSRSDSVKRVQPRTGTC
ncbi:unnamed protein product, partial [Staurois parvus]